MTGIPTQRETSRLWVRPWHGQVPLPPLQHQSIPHSHICSRGTGARSCPQQHKLLFRSQAAHIPFWSHYSLNPLVFLQRHTPALPPLGQGINPSYYLYKPGSHFLPLLMAETSQRMVVFEVKLCLNKQCLWEDHTDLEIKHKPLLFYTNHREPEKKHFQFFISPKPYEISLPQTKLALCQEKIQLNLQWNKNLKFWKCCSVASAHSFPCWRSSIWMIIFQPNTKSKIPYWCFRKFCTHSHFFLFSYRFWGHSLKVFVLLLQCCRCPSADEFVLPAQEMLTKRAGAIRAV